MTESKKGPCPTCGRYLMSAGFSKENVPRGAKLYRAHGSACAAPSRDPRKRIVFFASDELAEIHAEAERLDRSISWVIQRAWKVARSRIRSDGGARG